MYIGEVKTMSDHFALQFKPIPKLLAAAKALPGRSWNHNEKYWRVPLDKREYVVDFAKKFGLDFDRPTEAKNHLQFVIPPMPELTVPVTLKRDLRPYQQTGVAYIINKKRLIIADDMGLGKTFQAIAAMAALHQNGSDVFPALIICPSAVKENWVKEVQLNTHYKGLVLQHSIRNTFPEYYRTGLAQFFVTNYESIAKYFVDHIDDPGINEETGKKKPLRINHIHFKAKYINFFKSVIVDESHKVKDLKTKNTKFTKGIASGKETIFLLTGTPVVNKPKDLISQLGILDRLKDFGGYQYFNKQYCGGPKEASNLAELNYKLNVNCFYRRNKTDPDIKKYLPDKMRQVVMCDLSETYKKEYAHAEADLENYMAAFKNKSAEDIEKSMKGAVMVKIGILKNISARGKLKDAFSFIRDVIENGQKIVVFGNLTEVIDAVQKEFPRSVRITGREDSKQKEINKMRFIEDPNIDVCVLNLKAGGVGIDGLQNVASQICFIEFGWHAAIMDQAEDRLYRTGQHANVMCTYFLGRNTIDDWNYQIINDKRDIANTVTGSEDKTEESLVDNIINLFTHKK